MKPNPILQKVVRVILQTVSCANIVLLAYINQKQEVYSIFENTSFEVEDPAELNVFVVATICTGERHAAVDTIEQRCRSFIPLTILLMSIEDFAGLVRRRTPFADAILNSNQLLFKNRTKAEWESGQGNEVAEPTNIDIELARWYKRAITFWEIAGTQFRFGEYGMAAFCIHQAAEQFMCMLIQSCIGYRVGTHNLDRLLRLLHFYIPEIDNVFSRETAQEKEQFLLLKSTYIHFRYHPNYNISEEDVRYFIREVVKLHGIAERIFYSKTSILLSCSRLQGV